MKKKFPRKGARIEIVCGISPYFKTGDRGIVMICDAFSSAIGIRFDNFSRRYHNLGGRCEMGHGRWVQLRNLREISTDDDFHFNDRKTFDRRRCF